MINMTMVEASLTTLIEAIGQSADDLSIQASILAAIKELGGDNFVFVTFLADDDGGSVECYRFMTAAAPSWCRDYIEKKWWAIDPALRAIREHADSYQTDQVGFSRPAGPA